MSLRENASMTAHCRSVENDGNETIPGLTHSPTPKSKSFFTSLVNLRVLDIVIITESSKYRGVTVGIYIAQCKRCIASKVG
jgi:hypothetical protein